MAFTPSTTRRTAVSVGIIIVLFMVAFWAFHALSSFLFLLLLAWLLSIGMEPMVLLLTGRGVKRSLASGLTMLLLLLVLIGIGALFGQLLLAQVDALSKALPGTISSGLDWVNSTFKTKIDVASVERSMDLTPARIATFATSYGGGLIGVFGSVVTALFDGLTILVFAYYLSADSITLRQTIGRFLPPRHQPMLMTVWTISVEKTGGFVTSKVVLAAISAVAHGAFFWVIGVPFWLPLGIVAGVVGQFIPTIGTYVGVLLPCLFAATSKPVTVLYIIVFATIYQQIENYVLTPRISRRTMDIHPAVALAAVFIGAALFGPVGAIIGIPVTAAVLSIVETFHHRYELHPELAALDDDITERPQADDEVAAPAPTDAVDS
ncbi:AI-2E family transporter [Nostocoides sp. HKS02]|uniref:AI-2E family transporter n=1 Tax=Nostocoides sp. HKS02 TaxID=1813880 RepID=UPI0018A817CE|nr:AI-2E family transporter [Tetrasphaera sp. HKS02]